jgi:hypothetical protein
MSAGSHPTGEIHPRSLALLAREGIPTAGCRSKSWEHLPATPDIVVTVCASAAGETCPLYLGSALRTHWGVDDPAHVRGTEAEIEAAFTNAYRILRARIMLQTDLRRAGIDPWAWVINNSIAAAAPSSALLRQRAGAELPEIDAVATRHARRYAVVPMLSTEPVGVDRLLELAAGRRPVTHGD